MRSKEALIRVVADQGHYGGGYEIRTREGLPPTRFPISSPNDHVHTATTSSLTSAYVLGQQRPGTTLEHEASRVGARPTWSEEHMASLKRAAAVTARRAGACLGGLPIAVFPGGSAWTTPAHARRTTPHPPHTCPTPPVDSSRPSHSVDVRPDPPARFSKRCALGPYGSDARVSRLSRSKLPASSMR